MKNTTKNTKRQFNGFVLKNKLLSNKEKGKRMKKIWKGRKKTGDRVIIPRKKQIKTIVWDMDGTIIPKMSLGDWEVQKLLPGARKLLDYFKSKGFKQFLVTESCRYFCDQILEHNKLVGFFDGVYPGDVCLESDYFSKKQMLLLFGSECTKMYYIDDNPRYDFSPKKIIVVDSSAKEDNLIQRLFNLLEIKELAGEKSFFGQVWNKFMREKRTQRFLTRMNMF